MSVEDDIWQYVITSHGNQKSDSLSPEDAAWVDSCLIKDSELLDGSWSSLTEALLDILASQTSSSVALPSKVSNSAPDAKVDHAMNIEELEESEEGKGQICVRDDFHFPSLGFTEDERAEVGGFWEESVDKEDLYEDIFRVWDLRLPSEEDVIVKQLNEALVQSPGAKRCALNGVDTASENLVLDDLITSMAELSVQSWSN